MKLLKYLTFSLLLFLLSACNDNDFYELTIPFESPWQSVQDFDATVVGSYYNLTGNGGNGSIFANRRGHSILASDEGAFLSQAGGDNTVLSLYERDNIDENDWMNVVWRSSYGTIGNCNVGIDFLALNPFQGSADRDQLLRNEGELRFLRAFSYWSLAKAFCPPPQSPKAATTSILPLRINAPSGLAEAVTGDPAPTTEIYNLIIADLQKAKNLLPEAYDATVHPDTYQYGRVNKYTASAFLARVYFEMGEFTEALAECNFTIDQNGGRFDLSQDPIEAWNKTFNGQYDAKEVLWLYSLGATERQNGLGTTSNWKIPRRFRFYNRLSRFYDSSKPIADHNNNLRTVVASNKLLQTAGWMDVATRNETPEAAFDKRYTQLFERIEGGADPDFSAITEAQVWNNRYYRWDGGNVAGQGTSIPIIRLSEVYLTRAWLRFNSGDLTGAASDLNMIRSRAWDADAAGAPYTLITAAEITEQMIHNERMIELAFEGDRLHYLQALKLDIPAGDRGTTAIPYDDDKLWWPIPIREGELNNSI